MPRVASIPLALLALCHGSSLAVRQSRQPFRQLVWPIGGAPQVDGMPVDDVVLRWRGPLAFMQWRDCDGSIRRLAWWSDTLPAHARRELKLAAAGSAGVVPSMAP